MQHNNLLSILIVLMVAFLIVYFLPWKNINWGTVNMQPGEYVTVTGYADSQEGNQEASFTAGVSAVNDDKETALNEVNTKIEEIITQVKEFGIPEADIKTSNLSIYQNQEPYNEDGVSKSRLGQWNISNNVEIRLKDASQADELANLLASTGATNVWGPNFVTGDSRDAQKALMSSAIEDARSKAQEAANATGKELGRVLSISESSAVSGYPMAMFDRGMGGGGGISLEPGTSTVSQSVVVTFELR